MIIVIKFIDTFIGNLICRFLAFFNKKKDRTTAEIDKILVIQLWGVGETILTLPAIEALRKKFPKTKIDVLATSRNGDVYYHNKNIGDLFVIRLNFFSILRFISKNMKKYDLVVDMEEYLNISAIISFFAGKRIVGYAHDSRAKLYTDKIRYNDKQHAVQTFLDLVNALGIDYNANKLPKLDYSENDKNVVDKFLKSNGIKNK